MTADRVRVIKGSELGEPGEMSSVVRRAAVDEPELWAGISSVEPGVTTGWHHHGTNTTVFYMLSGELRVEFEGDPVASAAATAGDFAVVPAGAIHREIIDGSDGVEAVVVRYGNGEGPLTVDVEGPTGS